MSLKTAMSVALMLFAAAAAEAKDGLWLHIKVLDGSDGSRVNVSLPLSGVELAAPVLPAEARTATRLRIGDRDVTVADLRRIWSQVKSVPDATFITVDEADGSRLRVARRGSVLVVNAAGESAAHDGRVEMRIPAAVVDALLAGNAQTLDLAGAIAALARAGEGELVTVDGHNDTVRMWVSADAEGR
jgi:hypothetical protein